VDAQRPPLRVIIAGAGIGGLATCLALRRVGVDAHVYERAVCLKTDAGTGIALWPNGLKALRAIGADVERQVAERGADVKGVRFGVLRENVSSDTNAIPPREDETRPPTNDATNASASISRYLKSLVSAAATRVVPKTAPRQTRRWFALHSVGERARRAGEFFTEGVPPPGRDPE
jgi:2-polyprenyl-6-methoxyphenol hydroxylase-like FAD-dependent oxidoreductase